MTVKRWSMLAVILGACFWLGTCVSTSNYCWEGLNNEYCHIDKKDAKRSSENGSSRSHKRSVFLAVVSTGN